MAVYADNTYVHYGIQVSPAIEPNSAAPCSLPGRVARLAVSWLVVAAPLVDASSSALPWEDAKPARQEMLPELMDVDRWVQPQLASSCASDGAAAEADKVRRL